MYTILGRFVREHNLNMISQLYGVHINFRAPKGRGRYALVCIPESLSVCEWVVSALCIVRSASFFLEIVAFYTQTRGFHEYCRVPGNWQVSRLEVGQDNSKSEPQSVGKIQIH